MLKRLFPLALAMFAVGTDGFVIAGLLPAISEDLGVGVSAAGQLVTVFALTFAVTAPVLGAATGAMNRRSALLVALSVFVVGNAVTALGTTYEIILIARIITAAGAGLIGSAAFSTAAAMAPEDRRGRALAFVMGGLIVSTALGLPIGTLIGGAFDWRLTLWAVAVLGLIAGIGVALWVPRISLPGATLRARLSLVKEPWVLGVLVVTMTTLAGIHLLYTYIAAAVENATGGSATLLTIVLLAWGLGAVVGNAFAGRLTDRYPPERVLLWSLAASTVVLAVSSAVTTSLTTTVAWAAIWGICIALPVVPQQHRLVARAPRAAAVLLGLNSSAIYVGIAIGGGLGGLAQGWIAPTQLGVPAAVITAAALVLALATARPRPHGPRLERLLWAVQLTPYGLRGVDAPLLARDPRVHPLD